MDRDRAKVHKLVRKERGQYPAISTEQAWSIKDLLYGFCGNFSCGTRWVVASGQDCSILPARRASHMISGIFRDFSGKTPSSIANVKHLTLRSEDFLFGLCGSLFLFLGLMLQGKFTGYFQHFKLIQSVRVNSVSDCFNLSSFHNFLVYFTKQEITVL